MTIPDLSITIPTYNRAPYLQYLLGSLERQIGDLTHSYEIVISDNASTDDTETVVKSFLGKLNIVYVKRDKNYGPADNRIELVKHARGIVQLNIGDDDDLILSEVDKNVAQMLSNPSINVLFAPWTVYNRAENKFLAQTFYQQDNDFIIEKGDFSTLLTFVLKHHVFPEIYMIRGELVRALSMVTHPFAYWAFVHTAEYLNFGTIAFNKNPYYITITSHFVDDNRQQLGHMELLTAWDRYRGGLEYILSRIPAGSITAETSQHYLVMIQKFIAMRLSVCLRLRILGRMDPVDTYYLASRLRAMGYADLVPMDFKEIRVHAAVHHFLRSPTPSDTLDKLVLVGNIPESIMKALRMRSKQPPVLAENFSPEQYPRALTLVTGSLLDIKPDPALLAKYQVRVTGLTDLMHKFA